MKNASSAHIFIRPLVIVPEVSTVSIKWRILSVSEVAMLSKEAADELRGLAITFEILGKVLLSQPTEQSIACIKNLAASIGLPELEDIQFDAELVEQYNNRFLIVTSPLYIPLRESYIRQARVSERGIEFGSYSSAYERHLSQCYQAVGFVPKKYHNSDDMTPPPALDSMGIELTFISTVVYQLLSHIKNDIDISNNIHFISRFINTHISQWVYKAAEMLSLSSRDVYYYVLALAGEAVLELSNLLNELKLHS